MCLENRSLTCAIQQVRKRAFVTSAIVSDSITVPEGLSPMLFIFHFLLFPFPIPFTKLPTAPLACQ